MLWKKRTLKYPEVGSWWPFPELHLSLIIQAHSFKAITVNQVTECFGTRIFRCFHCCACTSGHCAKNSRGTWNCWKTGSRVEDWIIDSGKTVRAIFVCLGNVCVLGTQVVSPTQQEHERCLLLTICTTLYLLEHFSSALFYSFWDAGKPGAFKAAVVQ